MFISKFNIEKSEYGNKKRNNCVKLPSTQDNYY